MTNEDATIVVEALSAMKFFPSAEGARIAISNQLLSMCSDVTQGVWLANRALTLYGEWPGLPEIRAVLCSKFRPADGIEGSSTVYIDGIPSERPAPVAALPSPDAKRLNAGEITPDPEFAETVEKLAREKRFGVKAATAGEIAEVLEQQKRNRERAKFAAAV
jgi:hypothetical protein